MNQQKKRLWQLPAIQTTTVEAILETPIENGYLFHQPKYFFVYIADHVTEFLDIAINENLTISDFQFNEKNYGTVEGEKSRNAFLILSNSPKNVMDELLMDGRFLIKATTILGQACNCSHFKLSKSLASRVASIFTNLINKTKDKDIIIDSVGFLTQMIRFIEDPVIFDLFHLLVSVNDEFKEMQVLLSQVNLYEFVLDELLSGTNGDFENLLEKRSNLCIFIQDCLKNPILQDSFQNEKVLNALKEILQNANNTYLYSQECSDFGNAEIRFINNVWEALSFFPCKKLVDKMQPILPLSIEIVKNLTKSIATLDLPDAQNIDVYAHKILRKYHSCNFDLISKVAIMKPSMINSNMRSILIESINKIINVFPNSTNLIQSTFRVVKSSMLCHEFAKKMVDSLMPKLILLAKSTSRTAAAAAATHLLADMDRTKSSSTMINNFLTSDDEYMHFYNQYFKKYLEEAYVPYGGPVSKCVQYEIEKLKKEKKKKEKKEKKLNLKKIKSNNYLIGMKENLVANDLKPEVIVY